MVKMIVCDHTNQATNPENWLPESNQRRERQTDHNVQPVARPKRSRKNDQSRNRRNSAPVLEMALLRCSFRLLALTAFLNAFFCSPTGN